jgi:nitric oxide reductase subunit B
MPSTKALWITLAVAVSAVFLILGFFGSEVYRNAPPIPERVVTQDGRLLMTRDDILAGQEVWQSIGGQQVGTVWGHGAYQAPDWSADWLHREATGLLERWSQAEHGRAYAELGAEAQGGLLARLRQELRTNSFDAATGTLTVSADRAEVMAGVSGHYDALFGGDPRLHELRASYALQETPIADGARRARLGNFFFWTSWAAATERPGTSVTYTNNWPHEPLIGNVPSAANVLWSVVSIVVLLLGIGALVWYKAFRDHDEAPPKAPERDPLSSIVLTPSMRATAKYAAVVVLLLVVQVLLGAVTAHYTVEGQSLYGIPLAQILPYAVARTWHLQTGIFWIATAFLALGLFLAPAIGGREPRHQKLGVDVLFGALLLVVGGSLAGEWLRIQQRMGDGLGFWFGTQGYEYVDLGRAWQIALYAGLLLWLGLMARALWPALVRRDERRPLLMVFTGSVVAIGLLYGAGLFYGARTHLSVMEYWRWWVVHLWVEGFFEVFATAAVAFLFAHMGLVRQKTATAATLFSTILYLTAGIPGTFHHLYFSGTPVSIMAVGASFSALEVVPLVLVGFEAYQNVKLSRAAPWMQRYRWPITFFLGVSFWNLVGAGIFGFLINPPIALYYMQGLNTTPVHGHAALFGVYGLLALGLTLLVLRRLQPVGEWRTRWLSVAFWGMNGGLALMIMLSLLPIGLLQAYASIEHGLWYARSAEFLHTPLIQTLRWLRFLGDGVFMLGTGALAWFTLGLWRGWSFVRSDEPEASAAGEREAVTATR